MENPDARWGGYVFPRQWDEKKFLASLKKAQETPLASLAADGNPAIMLATTTDPYQVIRNSDPKVAKKLTDDHAAMVRQALTLIRDHSTLNVRILTRSPLAKKDFELFKSFGNRLLFGMSLPTLDNNLARIYEPHALAPTQRLESLKAAQAAGLNIYVAVAPTYPESTVEDLRAVLQAAKDLGATTIYHEPINIRAENVARIRAHAEELGVPLETDVFATAATWRAYALPQLQSVETLGTEVGVADKLHLWPDADLGTKAALDEITDKVQHKEWLNKWWTRVAPWPIRDATGAAVPHGKASILPNRKGMSFRRPGEILGMHFDGADEYIEGGILSKGLPCAIVGVPGVGKSRLVIQLAVCTILGQPFLGMPVNSKGLKWLILQDENSNRRLKTDLLGLKASVGDAAWVEIEKNLVFKTLENPSDSGLSLADPEVFDGLAKFVKGFKPDVIAFDPTESFSAGNLNNDAGMTETCKLMTELAQARGDGTMATPLAIHHSRTGKKAVKEATGHDRSSFGRGYKRPYAWTRGQFNVSPISEYSNQHILISCGKNSNGEEFKPIAAKLNPDKLIFQVDEEFSYEDWVRKSTETVGRQKFTSADIVSLIGEGTIRQPELVKKIVDAGECRKSTERARRLAPRRELV